MKVDKTLKTLKDSLTDYSWMRFLENNFMHMRKIEIDDFFPELIAFLIGISILLTVMGCVVTR